jgi:hypothetical protein
VLLPSSSHHSAAQAFERRGRGARLSLSINATGSSMFAAAAVTSGWRRNGSESAYSPRLTTMTGREFATLARRHLMPHLPDFLLERGHIYALPVDRIARGFHLYGSAFSRERFTISCTASLLYVPDSIGAALSGLGAACRSSPAVATSGGSGIRETIRRRRR